jgi:antitoxin component YwqK of YwqJK toxin-antitoxin module
MRNDQKLLVEAYENIMQSQHNQAKEAFYKNDEYDGQFKIYNRDQKLITIYNYKNGELILDKYQVYIHFN